MDFTYVRTWARFVYVAFILDVAQETVAWIVAATKAVDLVDVPLRMALWQRNREGHPVVRGELSATPTRARNTPPSRSPTTSPMLGRSPRPTTTR